MRRICFLLLFALVTKVHALDRMVGIELLNVKNSSAKVYVAIYDSAANYINGLQFKGYILVPEKSTILLREKIPDGYYVVSAFQDMNNNGKLDTNFLGMPTEPIGLSNYDGSGVPGGYNTLKVKVSADNQKIAIKMIKLF